MSLNNMLLEYSPNKGKITGSNWYHVTGVVYQEEIIAKDAKKNHLPAKELTYYVPTAKDSTSIAGSAG